MCEVEFWEVFLKGTKHFFEWFANEIPLVDCRIVDLEILVFLFLPNC
jgi:hypothetical protein